MKKHNFNPGPAILPQSVMEQASQAVEEYNGIGLSIMEISHRSSEFKEILSESEELVRNILKVGGDYAVLFLTGGASSQFYMAPMNLLNEDQTACYVDTGSWSTKAIKEAKLFGNINVLASSKDTNFNHIPKGYEVPEDATYLHLTSNNTIFGTQYHQWPETNVPFVCDMSSDIFSRQLPLDKFHLIYAGAQKNLGPAGTTLVIVKKDALGKVNRSIPSMLNYETHIAKSSAFNTPPVFPIFVCMLTLKWIEEQGGLAAMEKHNEEKAGIIYGAIDKSPLYQGVAAEEDRSLMNVTFTLTNADLEKDFLAACEAADCVGVKGHRSVGGFRASIYNSLTIESAKVLAGVMDDFAQKFG